MLGVCRESHVVRVWAPHATKVLLEVVQLDKSGLNVSVETTPSTPAKLQNDVENELNSVNSAEFQSINNAVSKEKIQPEAVAYECVRNQEGDDDVWVSPKIKEMAAGCDFKYRFCLESSWNDCFAGEGELLYRRDPCAREVDFDSKWCYHRAKPYIFTSTKADVASPRDWIVYELHLGTWATGSENESVFAAAINKLPHLKHCGFTAIQLMPTTEFGGLWGYNPRMLTSVHAPWGTANEFKKFIDVAHGLGIAVIVDLVLNHGCSKRNELWAFDGYSPGNNGGIYFDNGQDTPWGKKFAFETRGVQRYITDATLMWAAEYNVDGIRFDSAHNIPDWLCRNIIRELKTKYPSVFLICEVTPENPYYVNDIGFDSCWIHAAHFDVRHLLHNFDGSKLDMFKQLLGMFGWPRSTAGVRSVMGSHDQVGDRKNGHEDNGSHRYFVSRVGGRGNWHARAKCRMWYAVMAFSRGMPMVFQGTETSQEGFWHVDRPMNWHLVSDEFGSQMIACVRAANILRVGADALTHDDLKICHEDCKNGVIAFARSHGDSHFWIVVHMGEGQWDQPDYRVHCGVDGEYKLVFNSQDEAFGGWAGSASDAVSVSGGGGSMLMPKWWVGVYARH